MNRNGVRTLGLLLAMMMLFLSCAAAEGLAFSRDPDAMEEAAKSVMMLEVYDASDERTATGSGFLLFDDETLVTNAHVIEDAVKIIAVSDEGERYTLTKVKISNDRLDIAILKFDEPTGRKPLTVSSLKLKRGQPVVAIGSPKSWKNTVSIGNVSGLFTEDGESWIQFTAPISPGSSGGALFDDEGHVAGITTATSRHEDAQNINFAVSATEIVSLYHAWDGKVRALTDPAQEGDSGLIGKLEGLFGGFDTPKAAGEFSEFMGGLFAAIPDRIPGASEGAIAVRTHGREDLEASFQGLDPGPLIGKAEALPGNLGWNGSVPEGDAYLGGLFAKIPDTVPGASADSGKSGGDGSVPAGDAYLGGLFANIPDSVPGAAASGGKNDGAASLSGLLGGLTGKAGGKEDGTPGRRGLTVKEQLEASFRSLTED